MLSPLLSSVTFEPTSSIFPAASRPIPLGAYAQQRIIPAKIAIKVPDGISHEIAATLITKGLTTNYLLTKTYQLKAGEFVLFHAAAGGVGQIFAQWANSIGAKVIGTVGSHEKIKIAEERISELNILITQWRKQNDEQRKSKESS